MVATTIIESTTEHAWCHGVRAAVSNGNSLKPHGSRGQQHLSRARGRLRYSGGSPVRPHARHGRPTRELGKCVRAAVTISWLPRRPWPSGTRPSARRPALKRERQALASVVSSLYRIAEDHRRVDQLLLFVHGEELAVLLESVERRKERSRIDLKAIAAQCRQCGSQSARTLLWRRLGVFRA